MAVINKIQFKRGVKAVLEVKLAGDNKPSAGEPIFETDTNKLKIGDGIKDYKDLPYVSGSDYGEQIFFGTHYEFPITGEEDKLYVAKDEHKNYIWTGSKYEIIETDIKEIDCGNAATEF